jgi:hypothetical protein
MSVGPPTAMWLRLRGASLGFAATQGGCFLWPPLALAGIGNRLCRRFTGACIGISSQRASVASYS